MEKNINVCKNGKENVAQDSERKLNPDEMVRKYLKEWDDELEKANKYSKDPTSVTSFSWFWHEKELISIQKAIQQCYTRSMTQTDTSLSKEELEKIDKILGCVID